MASFQKRGTKWRAIVRVKGRYASDTFRTKTEAQRWAAEKELEFAAERRGEIPRGKTVGDLIDRFLVDGDPDKATRLRLTRAKEVPLGKDQGLLADVPLAYFAAPHVAAWRDMRLKTVQPGSVLREWNALSSMCTRACNEWRWLKHNPFKDAKRPEPPAPRRRRPEGDELARILFCLGYREGEPCLTKTARVGAAAVFAVETAMRAGEICALRPSSFNGRVAHLAHTKNGDPRDVPLSKKALAVLAQLPAGHFDITAPVLETLWRRAKLRAGVEGLTFHDLRREALTRLSKKVDVLTLAKISGHRDLKVLLNTYYAPRMEDVELD
jgi:integrase